MAIKDKLKTTGLELRDLASSNEPDEQAIRNKIAEVQKLINEVKEASEFVGNLEALIKNIENTTLKVLERKKETS